MSKINEWNTFKRTWKRLLQIRMNFDISNKINEIIDIVKSIAEQTNLLALNAAIESARAGNLAKAFLL